MTATFFLICTAAYLVGSVNIAIILFRLLGRQDPRTGFSRNPGATNVYRQAGLFWAAVVLLLDMAKALAAAALAVHWLPASQALWPGLLLISGNRYPCFHGFKGGKGVANYIGFCLYIAPFWTLGGGLAWPVVQKLSGHPFIASLALVTGLTSVMAWMYRPFPPAVAAAGLTGILIAVNHHQNIREFVAAKRQRTAKETHHARS